MDNTFADIAELSADKQELLEMLLEEEGDEIFSFPLSSAQRRLWFLDQLEAGSAAYNIPAAVRLNGSLDTRALEATLAEIVSRHESLRTTFAEVEGEPQQVVAPRLDVPLVVIDLSALPVDEREAELSRLATEEAQKPFDLAAGPLLRATLVRLGAKEHVALFTMHHIISDGWSMGVLIREVAALYDAFSRGAESPLAELEIQYADFAVWQHEYLQGETLETQLAYWREQLKDAPVLELPTDRVRPAVQSLRGAEVKIELPETLVNQLKELCAGEGATLFMLLLATFKVLLWRWSGQSDVVVGTPIAGRTRAEVEPLIGFFVNTLAMRTRLAGDASFRELLKQVREVALEAYAGQEVPFEMLVEELSPERNLSHTPLFQVMLVLQNAPQPELRLPGLTMSRIETTSRTAKFDLLLSLEESATGLAGTLEYSTDLYDEATVLRLLGHYETLLRSVVANPDQTIATLPLLTAKEEHELLVEWNASHAAYPRDRRITDLFEQQAARTPHNIAVSFEGAQLTYAELDRRANQLAHTLQRMGVGADSVVGICVERSMEMVVAVLGVLKAGGAYLPLDAEYPTERLAYMIENARVRVVLAQQSFIERVTTEGGDARVVNLDAHWRDVARESTERPANAATPNSLAYVIYTSGSTGKPKAVAMPHRPLVNLIAFQLRRSGAGAEARTLQFSSLSFDVSFQEIFSTWCAGGTLVLVREETRRDAGELWRTLSEEGVERLFLPFVALHHLAEVVTAEKTVPQNLRQVITAGEQLKITGSIRSMFEKLDGCTLDNQYGPSETHVVSAFMLDGAVADWPELPPIGRPIANTQLFVLDARMLPVPVGTTGELFIGGDCVARGYLRRADASSEKFVANPFGDEAGARLYRTGDLARYMPDGQIEFLGRIDHQVKIRGFRIELGEIEAALSLHESVRESVVVAHAEGAQKRLVAYVVGHGQETLSVGALRAHLQGRLPEYMIPALFVELEALPLTPNGKVDRRALPAPDASRPELAEGFIAPRNAVEEMLAGIWAGVLGVERVGVRDNFFDLGGHSLLATQLMSRVREVFGVEIALRRLFESPTVGALAKVVEQALNSGERAGDSQITTALREAPLPLSFAQERLWFLDQLEAGSAVYNIPAAVRLKGTLHLAALEQTLSEILRRHESLRTTFAVVAGQPVQVVAEAAPLTLPVHDLSSLPVGEREAEARRVVAAEAKLPFDLARGPLVRAMLVRLQEDEHLLVVVMHHVISDGWSMGVLVHEVGALYAAFAQGEASPLAELEIQYADYAVWQREHLRGERLETQLAYWREQLKDVPVLELPTDRARPAVQSHRGAQFPLELPATLHEELQRMSRREGVTQFMVLLAAFKVLMSRWSGQSDVVVGTPIAGRTRAEVEPLIGFFVNTLAMRTELSGNPTFRELLRRVREVALAAYAHQEVPFERLVEELAPEREMSHSPLVQVMFVLQNAPREALELPGVVLDAVDVESETAKFDVMLVLEEVGGRLEAKWEYNTDLFDAATVARMALHFQTILESVVEQPEQTLAEIKMLAAAERQQLLVEWNDTATVYPSDVCVHQIFETQAARTPDAVVVVFGDERVSYSELNARANRIAHYLRALGVETETRVGICMERSVEMIAALIGTLKAGGVYVPLDPQYPAERLQFMLEDTRAEVLLTEKSLGESVPACGAQVVCFDAVREIIGEQSGENLDVRVAPDCLAYVMYTSGSTGRPKGVGVTHRNIARLVKETNYADFGEGEVFLQLAPVSFDASTFEIWGSLLNGARLVVMQPGLPSLEELGATLREHGVTTLWLTAGLFHQMVDERVGDLAGVRQLLAGGDVLSAPHVRRLLGETTTVQLINGYGPTESTTFACCYPMTVAQQFDVSVPIGRPIANTEVFILDARLEPVPAGVAGEIYIGGDGLARGYLNRAELTAERFVPHPFNNAGGARLYRTGDLARFLHDGAIEFLGRADYQVKLRGFRIELGEVEAVLRSHEAVRDAVAVVREAQPGGDKRLAAYVVLADESSSAPPSAELRRFMQETLPDYMIPSAFVVLDELPLTPNGKVDRRALPAPDASRSAADEGFVAPRNAVEEMLAGVWSELLGTGAVGVHDNFFELGGHSLLATQLMSRVREIFQTEIPLRTLFESPTVAALASEIERETKALGGVEVVPVAPATRNADLPLSFAQKRLWFLDQLEPGSTAYNIPATVRLAGRLNVAALEGALSEILRRHESLRTTFAVADEQPVQLISPPAPFALALRDLLSLPAEIRQDEAQRIIADESKHSFNLTTGPLFRATLVRLQEDEHLLVIVMHHIVSDGWSMGVLIREVAALYDAFSRGAESPLAELEIQYADYAVWQREQLQGEVLETQLAYWREQLKNVPVLELPTDRARPAVQSLRGGELTMELSATLHEELQRMSRREGVTQFMVLLAAFKVLMSRWSGQSDVVVGTPIAGRTRAEVEPLIGFFVNTLAMRTRVDGEMSFGELLKQVREVALEAYGHQEVPFEMLVEELSPERNLSHTPLFQVFFNMLNFSDATIRLDGLTVENVVSPEAVSKFDLNLYVREPGEGIEFTLVYNADLFEQSRMRELLEQFEALLSQALENPDEKISRLSLVTRAAETLLPNPTAALGDASGELVHERFARQAACRPEQTAIVGVGERWSYGELERRSNQLANMLVGSGIERGEVVAIYGHRSASLVWAMLGVMKAGTAFVILDPAYPTARLADYLDIAKPAAWIQLEAAGALPDELAAYVVSLGLRVSVALPALAGAAEENFLDEHASTSPSVAVEAGDLAYVAFTSGSTGRPKGIAGEHRPLSHFLEWYCATFELGEDERFSMLSGLAHDPLLRDIFAPLWLGATLCIPATDETGVLADDVAAWMRREKISVAHMAPAMVQLLAGTSDVEGNGALNEVNASSNVAGAVESLRYVFFSGDALTTRDVARVQRLAPSATCVNFYGATETPQAMGYFVVSGATVGASDGGGNMKSVVPVGRGISDVQLLVLNAAQGLAGVGELGEIYVRTAYLARGYYGDEAATAERFISNPFTGAAGDRLYRTGDLARYLPDGQIEFLGRIDHQVKIRGFRIELGEIEALVARHKDVREAVVVAREDGGEKRLVAYVVAREEDAQLNVGQLREFVRGRLPEYMIPATWVLLQALPLTPNGKIDRRALPAPDASKLAAGQAYVAPRTATEEMLVGMWERLLGAARVGVHDNFFELGGHSLLATQLMSRVREAFAVEIALRRLFESPTVAGLAKAIEGAMNDGADLQSPSIERVSRDGGDLALSFAQERVWVLDQLEPGNTFFNIHQAFRLRGQLDIAALEASLNEVVRRHEALRTTFKMSGGRAAQVVAPFEAFNLAVVNLEGLTETEREREAARLAAEEARRPFNLAEGPLLRVGLLRLGEAEHVVLVTLHHIIADGWSVGILIREMASLYEAFTAGGASPLGELRVQYADVAAWQRAWLRGDALEAQLGYWRNKLADAAPALELPTDRPRPTTQLARGARRSVALPANLVSQLKAMGRDEGVTPFISMLTALNIALFKWTRQRDIVVGTVVAGRNKLEAEDLIGCFMNFLPVRSDVRGDVSARELLKQVRASVFEMYAHADCPFEKIVEAINPERTLNRNPLYNVAFLMQNFPRSYSFSDTLEAEALPSEHESSLLDLRVVAEEYADGIQLWCEYSTDLFDADTIEHFLDGYCATLEQFAAKPEKTIESFELPRELHAKAEAARVRERKLTVAITSTFTAEPVEDSVNFWMQQLDMPARFEFAPYNQVFQQLLDPASLVATNQHGVNVVLVRFEDWERYRGGEDATTASPEAATTVSTQAIERNVNDLVVALEAAAARTATPFLVCLCPASPATLADASRADFFARMENLVAARLESASGVHVVTTAELAATYPVADYYDAHADRLGHVPYTRAFFTALGTMISRKIRATRSTPYKVVVLDCDDTLWKGVCGEDGAHGIEIDAARRALQEFVVAQHDRGMLVCLCSKNNEEDVHEVFRCRAAEMPLRSEHVAASRINWKPKSENIKSLAAELRLGLDSFIFIDNDPVICMEVQANCPEVLTLQLPPEVEKIPRFLKHVWAFDRLKVTDEDRKRTSLYRENSSREALRNTSLNLDDFLAAIELKVNISEMGTAHLARVAQLTQRTNQFNCTTIRRTESEIQNLCASGGAECLVFEVGDRFGDYGLVGVVIFQAAGTSLRVDTFLLSCRAMGRNVEHRMLARLGEIAIERDLSDVEILFVPTAKNQPALDFLSGVGASYQQSTDGGSLFKLPAAYVATLAANECADEPVETGKAV